MFFVRSGAAPSAVVDAIYCIYWLYREKTNDQELRHQCQSSGYDRLDHCVLLNSSIRIISKLHPSLSDIPLHEILVPNSIFCIQSLVMSITRSGKWHDVNHRLAISN